MAPAEPADKPAIRAYMEAWTARAESVAGDTAVTVIDPDTNTQFVHQVPAEYLRREPFLIDPATLAGRAALDWDLCGMAFRSERLLASTPYPYYQEMLRRIGYHEVPGAAHFAYGPDCPVPTFHIDWSKKHLPTWMEQQAAAAGAVIAPVVPANVFGFTAREQEVAQMVLAGLSNPEIASRLGVSVITVKKHLGHVFRKTGVKNRTELVKRLLEPGSMGS